MYESYFSFRRLTKEQKALLQAFAETESFSGTVNNMTQTATGKFYNHYDQTAMWIIFNINV
jgi:hypothetical protein